MSAFLSLLLASAAAVLTLACVRYSSGTRRGALFAAALACLGASFYWGDVFGGFWSGFYTLLSVYFLACMVLPWLVLYRVRRRAG